MNVLNVDENALRDENVRGAGNFDNRTGVCNFVWADEISKGLARVASSQFDLALFLLVVFQELLRRFTAQRRVCVTLHQLPGASRNAFLQDDPSIQEAVRRSQRKGDEAADYEGHMQPPIGGHFSFTRDCDRLKQTSFKDAVSSEFSIHCSTWWSGTTLVGFIEYETDQWDRYVAESMVNSYRTLLLSAFSNLDVKLSSLEILSEREIAALDAWNETKRDYPQMCVDQLFEACVSEHPDLTAITFEGSRLTYRDLLDRSNHLGASLETLGVRSGALVAICMDRGAEMVAAMLAILKQGAAYLPLDPDFPDERIASILEDARPAVIITQPHLLDRLSATGTQILSVNGVVPGLLSTVESGSSPIKRSSLEGLAYVIYTSGTTGKAKGVQITNRSLTNSVTSVVAELALRPSDVFLATNNICFDISAFEIFAPLVSGAHLVIAPQSVTMSGELLGASVQADNASVLQATPSGWRVLLEAGWQGQPGLKMLSAGEPLSHPLALQLLDRGAALWNLYGPTEAAVYSTIKRITKDDPSITVGHPLANCQIYVLDRNRNRLPIGAVGELYIGGVGVGAGYLNRPELTCQRFIANPFSNDAGSRLYRTGDLARYLASGEIDVLGRLDTQVKLRGYRIELEEIEAVLDRHPAISKAIVRVIDVSEDDQRLVAYTAVRDGQKFTDAELRDHAQRYLPWQMVPTSIVRVSAFALTQNGKVDRRALPPAELQKSSAIMEAPKDEVESIVLYCWQSVLNAPDLTLDHNFFEAGGHSLLAIRMLTGLGNKVGVKLPSNLLVDWPTPRTFAEHIRKMKESPVRCLVPMQTQGTRAPLYFVHHILGDISLYQAIASCFAPHRVVIGVRPPPDLTQRSPRYSLADLAAKYIDELLENQGLGPFHLAGFSSGAIIAFEMARQLTERGHEVGMLALIDGDIQTLPLMSGIQLYAMKAIRKVSKIIFKLKDELKEGPSRFVAKRLHYFSLSMRMRELQGSAGEASRQITVEEALLLAEKTYQPKRYIGSALLIRFHDEAWHLGPDPLMGWGSLMEDGVEPINYPGGHITGMSEAGAPGLAGVLRRKMEEAEAAGHRRHRSERARAAETATDRAIAV